MRQAVLDGSRMCCGDYDPVWSPDGSASIIVKESGTSGPVWELPVDGGTPRRIPAEDPRWSMAYTMRPAAYSPDGSRAAFIVSVSNSIVVSASDGTQRQVLIEAEPGHFGAPLWSPTGDRIAYVVTRDLTFDPDGFPTQQDYDLRLVDPRTGTATTLASARGSGGLSLLGFAPYGDPILFGQTDENDRSSLWSVNVDGSGARMLVAGTDVGGWLTMPAGASAP